MGNRITQTDANGHATSYSYDQRGRRLQRKLPLGQTESYTYDPNGNVATRTDFNGRTTSYSYDAGNRLLTKNADPYFVFNHIGAAAVTFSYDRYGQRSTMSDAAGTTSWVQYDFENRLISANGITYTYDGDGKTVNGTTVTFATSYINPTGYSQVLQENYSPNGPNKEYPLPQHLHRTLLVDGFV